MQVLRPTAGRHRGAHPSAGEPVVPGLRVSAGAVGYLGYDVVRAFERLPKSPKDDLDLPDAVFLLADTLVIIDNVFGRAIVVANTRPPLGASATQLRREFDEADGRIHELLARIAKPPALAAVAWTARQTCHARARTVRRRSSVTSR